MGRLHALVAAALLCACGEPAPTAAPPSRVVAVGKKAPAADVLDDFCDVLHPPGKGAPLRLPPFEGTAPETRGQFRWVNLWATWCKPCVEEIPRIEGFLERFAKQGKTVSFELVSVDTDATLIEKFRATHAGIPSSLRLTDVSTLQPWLQSLGLDEGAGLPIHVFIEETSHVRCVRAGAVTDNDYDAVASLVK